MEISLFYPEGLNTPRICLHFHDTEVAMVWIYQYELNEVHVTSWEILYTHSSEHMEALASFITQYIKSSLVQRL